MKWVELPLKTTWKTNPGKPDEQSHEQDLTCSICLDPAVEVGPHPVLTNMSMLTTSNGTKMVAISYAELMAKLNPPADPRAHHTFNEGGLSD